MAGNRASQPLARLFARAGIEVSIANTRGPESIRPLARECGPAVKAVTVADALDALDALAGFGLREETVLDLIRARPDDDPVPLRRSRFRVPVAEINDSLLRSRGEDRNRLTALPGSC